MTSGYRNDGLYPEESFDNGETDLLVPLASEDDESFTKEYNIQQEEMMEKENGLWKCLKCGKVLKHKGHMRSHIETHIEGGSYSCNSCGKAYRTRHSLQVHTSMKHKK